MRILLAIPHFYDSQPSAQNHHGSGRTNPTVRANALAECLATLRQNFGRPQCAIDIFRKTTVPANQLTAVKLDVIVCTTKGHHLLDRTGLGPGYFEHHATHAEPLLLGYECHAVLRDRLAMAYDFYGFLEDDLIVRDAWFFEKLAWFNRTFGDASLLMPNRCERARDQIVHKSYIDGPIREGASSPYQNIHAVPMLEADVLGRRIGFHRSTNPHSGSFFLTRSQLAAWANQPFFLDRSAAFIGPLESAATLGAMKAFRVYKPIPENAAFLEIEHSGTGFLNRIIPPPT